MAPTISEVDPERGDRITDLMNQAGWTAMSLAERIGCDRGTPWRWQQGEPISGRYFGSLVEALETTRRWIVSGGGPALSADPGWAAEKAEEKMDEAKRLREQGEEDDATGSAEAGG